jgi:hypothetical protein
MDQFTDTARTTAQPSNACRAYSMVQELALKCTLAALKDLENQQLNIPSGPATPANLIVTSSSSRGSGVCRSLATHLSSPASARFIARPTPAVGATIVPS